MILVDIHVAQRMDPNDVGDPLSFHVTRSSGQAF